MKFNKYIYFFTLGIATGEILTFLDLFLDLSFWLEMGIFSIISLSIMIIFRNKL